LFFSLLPFLCAQSAQTQSRNASSSEVKQLQQQLQQMQSEMEQLRDQVRTLQEERKPSLRNATFVVPAPTESVSPEASTNGAGVTSATVAANATSDAAPQTASTPSQSERSLDIYGFAMLDAGQDFKSIDPNWYDSLRPTKLPSPPGTFGQNGNARGHIRGLKWFVHGTVTLHRDDAGSVTILADTYHFMQHDISFSDPYWRGEVKRNVETWIGFQVATFGGITELWASITGGNHATNYKSTFCGNPEVVQP